MLIAGLGFGQIKVVNTGDVGIGTSTPSNKLDVNGTTSISNGDFIINGAGGASRIKGTDPSKRVEVLNNNTTTASKSYFQLFGDHATRSGEMTFAGTYLRFFSNVDNGTFGSEAARITAAGNMGIGIGNPAEKLHVGGNILATGTITSSDRDLKNNIKAYSRGLKDLLRINPVTFKYNGKAGITSNRTHVGVIAQEIDEIAPELVGKYDYIEEDIDRKNVSQVETYNYVDEKGIIYMLVNSVKEQQDIIEAKDQLIEENTQRIRSLEEKIDLLLENQLNGVTESELHLTYYDLAELKQNAPNPFNGETRISYTIPSKASSAQLVIFDQTGTLIKTMNINHKGEGVVTVKASDMPSGIYSYKLIVDGVSVSAKRMNLTR